MTVKISKPAVNVREKLSELDKPSGIAGEAMLRADTPQEQFELIGAGRKNLLINGNFDVWQRGTTSYSDTLNGYQTADRWNINNSSGTSIQTRQNFVVGQTDVPGFPRHYFRLTAQVANNNQGIHQRVGDVRVLAGRTVTLSFWARGTNPTAGHFVSSWIQDFGAGGSADLETLMDDRIVLTPEFKKYTITTTVPSVSGKTVGPSSWTWVEVLRQAASDTGTDAWEADIASVQLEFGSVATPFEHRSYGEELALCQRYFQKNGSTSGKNEGVSVAYSTTRLRGQFQSFATTMRTDPSVTLTDAEYYGNLNSSDQWITPSASSANEPSVDGFCIDITAHAQSTFSTSVAHPIQYGWEADAEL